LVRLMAPFTPYLSELMWQNMKHLLDEEAGLSSSESVHYLMLPTANESLMDEEVERKVSVMQTVIDLTRVLRDRKTLPVKYPLKEIVVVHKDQKILDDAQFLKNYILEEVNVRQLTTSSEKERWGVQLTVEPDYKALGPRLGKNLKAGVEMLKKLREADLDQLREKGSMDVFGEEVKFEDLKISYSLNNQKMHDLYEADSDGNIIVLLDISSDQSMQDEGLAREIVNRIQKLRKKAKLVPQDDITVYCSVLPPDSELARVLVEQKDYVEQNIKQPLFLNVTPDNGVKVIITEASDVKGTQLHVTLCSRNHE